jgi:hypothetical protein
VKTRDIAALLDKYRVTDGRDFKLKHYSPADQGGHAITKEAADALLADGVARLSALQNRLYAQDRWALLAAFQAMDAAGKDGTIKHVMTGINPQGVQVTSFKQPGPEALDHDFMWRIHAKVPERGRIGIFNRSHYEEVLEASAGGYRRIRDLPGAAGRGAGQVLPASVTRRTEAPVPGAYRHARQELEVFRRGFEGTQLLGGLSGGV